MRNKKFKLPKLQFATDSLEPYISQKTIELHHGRHLQTYIDNLNMLIDGTKYENSTLEEIVKMADGAIFNNAAQTWNHNFYFDTLSKSGEKRPSGELLDNINIVFGSFDLFQEKFEKAGATLFGSGWVWLSKSRNGELVITQGTNAHTPLRDGYTPLLTFDVWEHAYYIDYHNRRPEHLASMWNVINWSVVEARYEPVKVLEEAL